MKATDLIYESRAVQLLVGAFQFIEKSALSSKILLMTQTLLESVYPRWIFERLDAANEKHKGYVSENIFAPGFIIPIGYMLFLSISSYRISNLALYTIAVGILFYYAGLRSVKTEFTSIRQSHNTFRIGFSLYVLGAIFLIADLWAAGAVPILDPSARSRLVVVYTMLAQLIPLGGILMIAHLGEEYKKGTAPLKTARITSFGILVLSILLISLLGFRTQVMIILIGSFIAMYFTSLVGFVEVLLSLSIAVFGAVALGFMRALMQGSPIGFFEIMGARIGLTLSVYDYLVGRFLPFGANKGYTLLASFSSFIPGIPGPRLGPRTIVARLFGITGISVTSTLLGTVVLDFGIVGVAVFMLLLGHVLGTAHRAAKTGFAMGIGIYSVLLSYTLVGIETGLVDFNVLMMFFTGYLILRKSDTA